MLLVLCCGYVLWQNGRLNQEKTFTKARREDFTITRLYLYEIIKTGLNARPPRNKVNVPPTRPGHWAVLAEIEFVTRGNNWNRWAASFRLQCPFLYQLVDPVIMGIADLQKFDLHASGSNLQRWFGGWWYTLLKSSDILLVFHKNYILYPPLRIIFDKTN